MSGNWEQKGSEKYSDKVDVRGTPFKIWPDDMEATIVSEEPTIIQTQFKDHEQYRDKLIERIFELEQDEDYTHRFECGGSKIRYLHTWGCPEADLLNARATAFFSNIIGRNDAVITASWANVSRKNEYLAAHSHEKCVASLVYMLEPGDPDPDNVLSGRFAITDPRVKGCCNHEAERVTMEVSPDMQAGSMLIFPSEIVHHVHPYTGEKPRITVAWNFHLEEFMEES